jgi:ribosome-associated protein
MLEITTTIGIPLDEFSWSYARSGGPGGQNVNKVASKAVMRWDFANSPNVPDAVKDRFRTSFGNRITESGEVVMSSELTRDQGRNREDCLEKLAEMLRSVAKPPKIRHKTKPSKASKRRRLDAKKHNAATKAGRKSPNRDD